MAFPGPEKVIQIIHIEGSVYGLTDYSNLVRWSFKEGKWEDATWKSVAPVAAGPTASAPAGKS